MGRAPLLPFAHFTHLLVTPSALYTYPLHPCNFQAAHDNLHLSPSHILQSLTNSCKPLQPLSPPCPCHSLAVSKTPLSPIQLLVISWQPVTTRYSLYPPHYCHLLAAHYSSQLLLPSPSFLPPSCSSRLLVKAPSSTLISATPRQLSVRNTALPSLIPDIRWQFIATHACPTLPPHLCHSRDASTSPFHLMPTLEGKLKITLNKHSLRPPL